jgi:hypothetical protein
MAMFKVTILVDDGLSLGSILMTKHVELLHIDEVSKVEMRMEKSSIAQHEVMKLIGNVKPNTRSIAQQNKFYHPSGRTVKEFVMEYMGLEPNKSHAWKDLRTHVETQGFSKSSINNGIARLLKDKKIRRDRVGKYKLIKSSS